jgi:hypothetical protein
VQEVVVRPCEWLRDGFVSWPWRLPVRLKEMARARRKVAAFRWFVVLVHVTQREVDAAKARCR